MSSLLIISNPNESMQVQSVLASKRVFNLSQAKRKVKSLGFNISKMDETPDNYRYRQIDPEKLDIFATSKPITKGIKFIYGKESNKMARKTRRRPAAKRRVSAKPRRKVYAKRRRPRVNPANPTRRTYKRRRKARRNPDIPIAEIAIGLTVVAAVKAGVDYAAKKYPTMPGIAKKLAPAIAGAGGAFIMKKKKALALTMLAGGAAVTVDELVRPMINGGLSLTGKEMQDAGLPTQGMSQVQEFTEADVDRMRLSALVTSEVFSPGMGALQEAGQLAALQEAGQLAALQEAGQLAALQEAGQLGALQETAGISQYELNQVSLSPYDLNQYQLNQAKRRSLGADSV